MSGIAGIIHFDGRPVEPGLIEKMTGAMAHRGPDGINHWVKGSVALGQCMLRTTPESLEEHQPLANEDESLVLVMDGRVDNWEELRRELLSRGAVLRSRADAELVLRAYEIWGEECPDRIIGEYVFFIWDARQRRLFGARDAAGTRHFYYHAGNNWFGFASEIRGLLALGRIEPRLNESRLLDYLVVEFDRDDEVGTFYQDINRIPAGHAMSASENGARAWRYWNPGNLPATTYGSLQETADAFMEQFRIAVKWRLRNIGPVGAMLSGGLDSSSIVGLISKEFRGHLSQPLRTFSLVRHDRENCSDWQSIRQIVESDDWIDPTIITSAVEQTVCQAFLDNLPNLDEPFLQDFCDSLVFDAAQSRGCRVILEGMGGDLLFYHPGNSADHIFRSKAYWRIPFLLAACQRHGVQRYCLMKVAQQLYARMPNGLRDRYRALRDKWLVKGNGLHRMEGSLLAWMHHETAREFLASRRSGREASLAQAGVSNDQAIHARNFTTGCLSFGHEMSAQRAFSRTVELRSPFSDRRVIEFALQMPIEAKLSIPWYKHILRLGSAGLLPESVRWRRDLWRHPGWRFNEALAAQSRRQFSEALPLGPSSKPENRWLSEAKVNEALENYSHTGDFTCGYNLLVLLGLSKWLTARPCLAKMLS